MDTSQETLGLEAFLNYLKGTKVQTNFFFFFLIRKNFNLVSFYVIFFYLSFRGPQKKFKMTSLNFKRQCRYFVDKPMSCMYG